MLRHLILLLVCIQVTTTAAHGPVRYPFTANKGQWPQQVLYRTSTGHGSLFVERDALTYVVRAGDIHQHTKAGTPAEAVHTHAYRVRFEGGRSRSHQGLDALPYYENHFIGNDRSKWAGHVPVHGAVRLKELYPGIDLLFHGQDALEYDLLVAAGADAGLIAMRYEGQDRLAVIDGRLVIGTTAGDVREEAPVAWQEVDGARRSVRCHYALQGDVVRFAFPDGYDARFPLVIDPVLSFCSFSGSTADNFGFTATYDASGHLYAGGIVFGAGYPVTLGAQQPTFAGNTIDMGLTKFSADGSTLAWSTYLGGADGNESPHSLVVDANDDLYVMGITGSDDFPTTAGCFDDIFGAGPAVLFTVGEGYTHWSGTDICVAHLNAAGSMLVGSTYVGGSQADGINNSTTTAYNYGDPFRGEIVLDHQGRPVVATTTMSDDIPTTPGAPFPSYRGGEQDGYVFAMDPGLTTQRWATFYGGSGVDACYSVQLDRNDEVFVTGGTASSDLSMAGTPLHTTRPGGVDGFVARFSASGSDLVAATYLGTTAYDQGYFVQLDTTDGVFIVGQTHGDYPITPGKYNNAGSSQFIQKLDHDLGTSVWSTLIGSGAGDEDISPSAFLVSDCGQIYFSGWGGLVNQFQSAINSTTFGLPATPDALQSGTDGSDFYLMVLEQEANGLHYATFFGGPASDEHVDGGTSRFSKTGVVYQAVCAGCGGNSDLPTTEGVWSRTNNSSNCNLGVFKMDFELGVTANFSATPFIGCAPATIHFQSTGSGTSWRWDFGDGSAPGLDEDPQHLYAAPGIYPVTLIAVDSTACNIADTLVLSVTINSPQQPAPAFTVATDPCDGTVVATNTTPGAGLTFHWEMGDGSSYTSEDVTHTYVNGGPYTIVLHANDALCSTEGTATETINVSLPSPVDAQFVASTADLCSGLSVTLVDQSSGPAGLQLAWDMGDGTQLTGPSLTHVYDASGTYIITLVALDPVCGGSDTRTTEVEVIGGAGLAPEDILVPNVFSPNGDGRNDVFFPMPSVNNGFVHLQVFNRWGMKMHETGGAFKPWKGDAESGDKAPDGVYYYLLDYTLPCSGGTLEGQRKGVVQLLR